MKGGSTRKIANNLVALGSAAVLTVYAAGYMKTRAAAERLESAGHRDTPGPPALHAPAPAPIPAAPEPKVVADKPVVAANPIRRAEPPATRVEVAKPAAAAPEPPLATPATPPVTPPVSSPVTPPQATAVPPDADPKPADPKPAEPPAPKPSLYKDGTYYGWGTSRHGSIQAAVIIEGGKIAGASIAQCLTRYSCSWIAHLVPQVVSRQSADVDYVSGATQSTYAFYDAVVEALSKAK